MGGKAVWGTWAFGLLVEGGLIARFDFNWLLE